MAQAIYFSLLVIALCSISECIRLNYICDNVDPSEKAVVTCESQTASLSCDQGTIKVLSANYGRTDRQTCSTGRPDNQLTNVQCTQSTSLSVVAIRCDGKTNCSIVAENAAFTDPCGGTYKYLTVSYKCVATPPPSPVEPSLAIVTCESQTAFLSCVQGVIKVLSANYGRTDRQTCSTGRPDNQLTNVQCTQSTSLSVVAIRCDGKTSCSIVAENAAFTDPCGGTYKYLTVSYKCVAPSPPSPLDPSEKAVVTCESQTASLSCDQGTIKVLSANYGRTDRQTCSTGRPDNQLTNVQCTLSTSLSVVAIRCDGKTSCSIVAENAAFTDPCGGTYKYLTVSYKCVAPPPPSPVDPSEKAVVTCESQTASLSCDQGTIKVLSANYGRTDRQTCSTGRPDNQLTNVQCTQSTSLSVVAIRCDGKTSCSIVAENAAFTDPCGGTYKYLTVSYKCVAPPPPSPVDPSEKAVVTCESQTASLSCDQGTIKVLSANYGRTDRQTCSTGRPDNQLTNVQCTLSTSLSVVAIRCDGKTSCSIVAENAAFTDPCGGTYKYLTVSYKCVAPPPPSPVDPSEKAVVTCESQTASLSCDQGTIKVLSANYGRTDRQTCSTGRPDNQLTNVQCTQSTSLSVVAIRCDGKTSCSIVAENAAFTDPCGGTYKYLTVSYKCVAPPPPSPVDPSEKAVVTCESQTASLSCDQGTIKVLSANYGRTDRQTCSTGRPDNQLTNVQCTQSTSLSVVAIRCDGKTSCSIVAENAAFTDPCGGTYKYLTVSYKCVAPPPPSPSPVDPSEKAVVTCESQTASLSCDQGTIKVLSANYGRTDRQTCSTGRPDNQLTNVQCTLSTSLSVVAIRCDGKTSCSIVAENAAFTDPCGGTYKYLTVSYKCVAPPPPSPVDPSEKAVVTCESQTASLSCDQGTIKVLSANYGRTDRQTCSTGRPDNQLTNVQCTQSTSLSVVAIRCDGKTSCSIVAENAAFTDPCGGTYKYLTVSYKCVAPPPPSPVDPSEKAVVTCESQTASLSCDQGTIKVLSANYGRTDRQTCSTGKPDNQLTNVQCTQSTSLSVVAIRCDGKTSCSIVAENAAFTDPCGGTYKYLTVSYKCVAPPPPSPSPVDPSEKAVVTCESQTASLSCDQGTIKVLSANYGRTDRQTCSTGRPDNQLTNVQCTLSTSLSVVAIRCDGKTSCSIVAENAAFTDPCGGTYKYLTVSYKCVAPPPPSPVDPSEKAVVTCESQTASLSCDQGTIKVLSANYGRTDRQTCSTGKPDNQLTNVQCTQSTSLSVVAIRCDGKTSCSIVAENAAFTDPCGGTYKYLTVSYKCVAPPPPSPVDPSEKAVVTCESQTASLSCDQGTIKVLSANYGRTDRQTCSTGRPDNQLTNVQCTQSTSLSVVAIRCDGKTSCSIVAENAAFTDPCGGTYKYLTVSYKCVAPPPPSPVDPSEKAVVTCESQTASLSCDQGTIKVLSANYGRTDRQTCSTGRPAYQLSNVQCTQSTSLSVVAIRCDGKTSCSIVAENAAFTDPCGGTYKYLTVSYKCVAPPPPSPEKAVVTCESQTASLSCDQGTIKVLSANYGRTDRQTCSTGRPNSQLLNVHCTQSTSLSVVAIRCDGKTSCSIVAENAAFTDPCGGTYKYLTVSYKCISAL